MFSQLLMKMMDPTIDKLLLKMITTNYPENPYVMMSASEKLTIKAVIEAGTSTNTGESAVTNEERDNSKFLIVQYNRGGFLSSHEQLVQLDAIEVQLGQGAYGGAVKTTVRSDSMDDHLRKAWHVRQGEDATINSRMPGINTSEEIINLLNSLKEKYDVPVGIKIAGTDYIENELEVIAKTSADFITIDGSEGGTTDAVYIGSIAVLAALQSQMTKAFPEESSLQLALFDGKLKDELDIDLAADHLTNFLISCVNEMKLAVQATGKNAVKKLNRSDLVTVDKELAEFLSIRYAGSHR